jgi:predicted aspartyl protease
MMRPTRRAILGALPVLGLAAPTIAQEQGDTRLAAVDDADFYVDSWVDIHGRPTVSVMINGSGPFRFMVDTGSATSVIAARHVEAVGAQPLGQVTVIGATGSAVMPLVELPSLQAGVVERTYLQVAVLPDEQLRREDGILGGEVFAGRRLIFDMGAKTIRIEPSKGQLRGAAPGNLSARNGLLAEIEGQVGSIPTRLMLDTGAKSCIANMALNDALMQRHPGLVRLEDARIFGVTGHGLTGQLITALPKVDMKAFTVEGVSCIAAPASIFDLWDLNREPAMIVGIDLLSRLASFSIDYGARQFDATLAAVQLNAGSLAVA